MISESMSGNWLFVAYIAVLLALVFAVEYGFAVGWYGEDTPSNTKQRFAHIAAILWPLTLIVAIPVLPLVLAYRFTKSRKSQKAL